MSEKTDLVAGGSDGEVVWERWQKKRVFVRALEGTYGELMSSCLISLGLPYAGHEMEGGPQNYGRRSLTRRPRRLLNRSRHISMCTRRVAMDRSMVI